MSEIMTIQGVECYEVDGTAYLKLEAVARGLGFTEIAASGNECVKWTRVKKYLGDLGFIDTSVDGVKLPDFIPENIFYRLAMKAKNCVAEEFQAKIADEIIPAIRKTGGYLTPAAEERLLAEFKKLADRVTALEDAATTPAPPSFAPPGLTMLPPGSELPKQSPGKAAQRRWTRTASEKLDLLTERFHMTGKQLLHSLYRYLEDTYNEDLTELRLQVMEEQGLEECSTMKAIFFNERLKTAFEKNIDNNLAPENRGW